jgi:hypothetical protein
MHMLGTHEEQLNTGLLTFSIRATVSQTILSVDIDSRTIYNFCRTSSRSQSFTIRRRTPPPPLRASRGTYVGTSPCIMLRVRPRSYPPRSTDRTPRALRLRPTGSWTAVQLDNRTPRHYSTFRAFSVLPVCFYRYQLHDARALSAAFSGPPSRP